MKKQRWGIKWNSGGTLHQEEDELDRKLQKGIHSRVRSYPDVRMMAALPSVGENDDDAAVIPLTNSPNTHGKQGWENQYSRFLKISKQQQQRIPPATLDEYPGSRSSSIGTTSSGTPLGVSPPMEDPVPISSEGSVRGGKLFSNLSFLVERPRRRQSSNSIASDELDETKRRGVPTSPGMSSARLAKRIDARLPSLIPPLRGETPGVMITTVDATMKKAFTDFHNSAANTEAPYLGDERSVHNVSNVFHSVPQKTILRPIAAVESWKIGRRYLILPAVYAACHPKTMQCLFATRSDVTEAQDGFSIRLGDCWLTQLKQNQEQPEWTTAHLVLQHNYLLEYDTADAAAASATVHLEYAVVKPHQHFKDTIELLCYGSPCAKADMKRILIRLPKTESTMQCRQQWIDAIHRMANLTLNDVYDMENAATLAESLYVKVKSVRNRSSGIQRALKIFDKKKFWKAVVKEQERADTIVREIAVQATIRAQTQDAIPVVQIHGVFETTEEIAIELELLEGTDLFRHVSSKNVLKEKEAARILQDVLTALAAMDSLGLAHRDIKPANLLMNHDTGVKVGDFGMSAFVQVDGLVRGRCGTPGYVAPEIFKTGAYGGYGNKVDVFSAGVTLYVCLCGYEPFYGETDRELKEANRRAKVDFPPEEWDHISPAAIDLIRRMTDADPTKRPSAKEALAHAFFQAS